MDKSTNDQTHTTLEQLTAETERRSRVPWWEKGAMLTIWALLAVLAAYALVDLLRRF